LAKQTFLVSTINELQQSEDWKNMATLIAFSTYGGGRQFEWILLLDPDSGQPAAQ
jgi:hypothetical protein